MEELRVDGVSIYLDERQPDRLLVSAKTRAAAVFPLGNSVPVDVRGFRFDMQLLGADGSPIGRVISTPDTAAARSTAAATTYIESLPDDSSRLTVEMETEANILLAEGGAALGRWIRASLEGTEAALEFIARGTAVVVLGIGDLGELLIEGLHVDRPVSFGASLSEATGAGELVGTEVVAAAATAAARGGRLAGLDPQLGRWRILGSHPDGGLAFEGDASFLSPVPISMSLPPLHLHARYGDSLLAVIETEAIRLQPNPNRTYTHFQGRLLHQVTPEGLSDLNGLASEILRGLMLGQETETKTEEQQQQLQGPVLQLEASLHPSPPPPLWLREGLEGVILGARVSAHQLLPSSLVRSLVLEDSEIEASGLSPSGPLGISARVAVLMEAFFGEGAPIAIERLGLDATVLEPRSGAVLAHISCTPPPATTTAAAAAGRAGGVVPLETPAVARQMPGGLYALELPLKMEMEVEDDEAFASFAVSAIQGEEATVLMEGSVSLDLQTPLGLLSLRGVRVRQAVPFRGLQGALQALTEGLRVLSFSVEDVTFDGREGRDSLSFMVDVMLGDSTPGEEGDMQISAGGLTLSLVDAEDGSILGEASVPEAIMGGGSHQMRVSGFLSEPSEQRREGKGSRLAAFMTRAINEEPLGVFIKWRDDRENLRPRWLGSIIDQLAISPKVAGYVLFLCPCSCISFSFSWRDSLLYT